MNGALNGVITVLVAIVGVASLAVIFSRNADTANVITASGTALANTLQAATGPVLNFGPSQRVAIGSGG